MASPDHENRQEIFARAFWDDDQEVYCARLRVREKLEANFLTIYMALVLVVALLVLATLLVVFWRLNAGEPIQALVSGLGTVVSGAGTVFLERKSKEARKNHNAVLELLRINCQGPKEAS
ncbi:hypothetical protein ACFL0I_01395 [Gemmatimonadota bacterium]